MKVDSHIVNAFEMLIKERGISYEELAEMFGVSNACITKWRKVGNGITEARWTQIFPVIKTYLPKDRIFINDAQKEQYSSAAAKQSGYVFEPKYVPLMVHVFSMDQISRYDDTLESIMQFGEKLKTRTTAYYPKHNDKSSIFAVEIEDVSMSPVLPQSTTVFACAGERPKNGSLVVTLPCNSRDAFLGIYTRTEDWFEIKAISGDKKVSGDVINAKNLISWVFPVLYYEVVTF